MSLKGWIADRFFRDLISQRVTQAVKVVDDDGWRDVTQAHPLARRWQDVHKGLQEAAEVCETNPLAARLVRMTTDFVIGAGSRVVGAPFALAFWNHPLNHMNTRIYAWCDELSRSGELFLVLSRNPTDRMSYVREVPALQIDRIDTDPQDLEHELRYHQLTDDPEGRVWLSPQYSVGSQAQSLSEDDPDQVMLHYAINRAVGQVRGRSDLAQITTWLNRYDMWLEDRVRINRYKGAYLWHVSIEGALPGTIEAKKAQYSRVPRPGSIIVTDGAETWAAIQPQIGADDVQADGKAIRLMIAAGAGVPLHFLAEGDSATRATAREMGTATYRHYAHRQFVFRSILLDVIHTAARRAGLGQIEADVTFESVLAQDDRRQATDPATAD